ncbi:monocarboxylate transporter 12-like [Dendronephthya gigantea]|uniref:monocarboxylate transporter 12-like n=1 Tax=Dendronephthya gigantea TaxID=151771 RepID=UPI00106ABA39|nr:monocarboxylate transporter 12-like [Dendronephthya gigantea]
MKLEVDSALSWLQAVSAFLFHAVFFGLVFSFGIFYVALLEEFPGQESETAWISGINFGFVMLTSPLTIKLIDYMPARVVCCAGTLLALLGLYLSSKASTIWVLYMTFGVMHGMGTNFCYISAIWVIRQNFRKHRDVAFGMASAGSGAGGILYGIVLPSIVESRGWRWAMQMVSYITLAFIIVSMMMVPVKQESEKCGKQERKNWLPWKTKLKQDRLSIPSPWRNRAFVVLSIAVLLCAFVSLVPYCHIVNYAIHQGVGRSKGDRLPLFISTGSLIGRIIVGRVSGFRGIRRITLCQVTFLVGCLATTLCTLATNYASLVVFCLVFGACDGAFSLLMAIVVDDVFLDKNQAMKAMGQLFQIMAIPYLLGAPLAGLIYTKTGSYQAAFFICGAVLFFATCLITLVRCLLQPKLSSPVLTLPEKIVVSPTEESTRDINIVPCTSSNRLISSRACSFLDLAIEVYGENRYQSNNLAVYSPSRRLGARNRKDGKICFQDFLENKASRIAGESNEPEYTDINTQISGLMETENTGITKMEEDCQAVQTQANLLQVDNKDVKLLVPKDNNAVTCLDGHSSDASSVENTDYVSKQRLSGSSTDDAGYFSAAALANYVDSDDQSVTSRCDVSIRIESQNESLDSLMDIDYNKDFNDNTNVTINMERNIEHVTGMPKNVNRVYE